MRTRVVAAVGHDSGIAADAALREVPVSGILDLRRTLGIHRRGPADPTMRLLPDGGVVRAWRTPVGPATLRLIPAGDRIRALAWGPGATAALAGVEALVGLEDDPSALRATHRVIAEAVLRVPGLRFGRTGHVLDALVPAILEQKVTGDEAHRAWTALVRVHGDPAPGPWGLHIPPSAATLLGLPYHAFHPFGVERRRADTIRRAVAMAQRVGADADAATVGAALRSVPGIGPWTVAEVAARAFGDPDAVSVGDFHLPHLVTWALAGEERGTDDRMLELLAPYAGQRGRVVRLLELTGPRPPRYGPRMAPRHIERT